MLALWRGLFIRRSHPRTINRCSTTRAPNPQRLPTIRCSPPSKATIILFSVPIDNSLWGYAEPPKVVPVILYSFLCPVTLGIHPNDRLYTIRMLLCSFYVLNFSHGHKRIIALVLFKETKIDINFPSLFSDNPSQLYVNYLDAQAKRNWTKANYLYQLCHFENSLLLLLLLLHWIAPLFAKGILLDDRFIFRCIPPIPNDSSSGISNGGN